MFAIFIVNKQFINQEGALVGLGVFKKSFGLLGGGNPAKDVEINPANEFGISTFWGGGDLFDGKFFGNLPINQFA